MKWYEITCPCGSKFVLSSLEATKKLFVDHLNIGHTQAEKLDIILQMIVPVVTVER